jgi:putative Holliday junction resolvase
MELPPATAADLCWIGVDPGLSRCGIAVADPTGTLATPLCAVPTEPRASLGARVQQAVAPRSIRGLVLGLPLDQRGGEGPAALSAREIGALLAEALSVEVRYMDERLSTREAAGRVADMQAARRGRPGARWERRTPPGQLDAIAACGILQSFLDHLAAHAGEE